MSKIGTVTIRWRETKRWHELTLTPSWKPADSDEALRYEACRLVWKGVPLVEARQTAKRVLGFAA